jgi:ELWxxDGT repeat protein
MLQRIFLLVLIPFLLSAPLPLQAQEARCFAETGFCISGRIRAFWEQNGGLPVFGFPTGPQQEMLIEGRSLQAQWFERTRLELHPQNDAPYDVLLGRIGVDRLAQQGRPNWPQFPIDPQAGDCRRFETGHAVCDELLNFWRSYGLEFDGRPGVSDAESLALFGLPVSSPTLEVLEGHVYTVQWFERARFELHPQNAPPYNVQLGLLGNEILHDGTVAPSPLGAMADGMIIVGEQIFFSAADAVHGQELWVSDGTPGGTRLLKDLLPGSAGSLPSWLTDLNGTLIFTARATEAAGDSLWRSDGTPAGTYELVSAERLFSIAQLTVVANHVYFIADDGVHGLELWASDGTAQGTRLVRDIYAGSRGSYPEQNMPMGYRNFALTKVGARLFFTAEAPDTGYGLWVSDGTAQGTTFVSRLNDGPVAPEFWELTALNDTTLLFIARTGRLNYALYRSDGTLAGTQFVADFSYARDPGSLRLYPLVDTMQTIGDRVYFRFNSTLWVSDGTPAGTLAITATPVDTIAGWDGVAYFLLRSRSGGMELRRVDTVNHSETVASIAPTLEAPAGALIPAAGRLFITVNSLGGRAELWMSDGSSAGTLPILAFNGRLLGQRDGFTGMRSATAFGSRIAFLADDGIHGGHLWISDGTPGGTYRLTNIAAP